MWKVSLIFPEVFLISCDKVEAKPLQISLPIPHFLSYFVISLGSYGNASNSIVNTMDTNRKAQTDFVLLFQSDTS